MREGKRKRDICNDFVAVRITILSLSLTLLHPSFPLCYSLPFPFSLLPLLPGHSQVMDSSGERDTCSFGSLLVVSYPECITGRLENKRGKEGEGEKPHLLTHSLTQSHTHSFYRGCYMFVCSYIPPIHSFTRTVNPFTSTPSLPSSLPPFLHFCYTPKNLLLLLFTDGFIIFFPLQTPFPSLLIPFIFHSLLDFTFLLNSPLR